MRDPRSAGVSGRFRPLWRRARQWRRSSVEYAAEALEDRRLLSSITGFTSFTLNGADGLGTNGSAKTDNNQGAAPTLNGTTTDLTITTAAANEASSVWYNAPVSYQNFTASFMYWRGGGTNPPANGIAFVLQNDSRGVHAIGGGGGDFGYATDGNHPAVAIANSFALELDVFDGSLTGIASGGGGMTNSQSTGRVNLASGYLINVILSYDSGSQTLSEMLTDATSGLSYSTSFANVNLPGLLGGGTAYVGFTGGTGAKYAEQAIYNFAFATHPSAPPPPGTAVGFTGFTLNGANGAGIDGSAPQDNNNGAAPTLSADQNTLTLTTAAANQASSAFTTAELPYHNFTTSFTYQPSGSTSPGNGFAFVLQLDSRATHALGGGGENLGYGTGASHPATAIGTSFAVEFNVYQVSSTAIGFNGSTSSLPTLGGNTGTVDLRSGDPINITLSYSDSTLIETLTDANTHATHTTSYANINVPWTLGYNTAFVGFTGGTGGAVALQTISNFTFTPYTSVPPPPPPPGPIQGFANFTLNRQVNWTGGSPAVSADKNTLTITPLWNRQANSALFNAAVPYQNFTASFTYTATGNPPADGFTFLLENDPRDVNAVAGAGDQLGYGTDANYPGAPISPSFAAEFSIYPTSSVSVDTNGDVNTPRNLYNTGPVSLSDGDPIAVTLSYNSVTNTLYETLTDAPANARYAVAFANVDLAAVVGGSTAYVGFTGGTEWSYYGTQTISNFTFQTSATVPPVPALPPPVKSLSGFSTFDQDGWSLNPAGVPAVSPTALTLTTAAYNEAATAFSTTPVSYGNFSATFNYYCTGGSTPANGFTFALEQTPVLGGAGGNLGYSPNVPNSLAVEFNVYQGSSISLGAGGSLSVPRGVSNTGNVNLASGDEIYVSIWYTGTSQTLNVNLFDLSTSMSYTASFANLDLSRLLGGGPAAYVGFTGATGGGGASQQTITAFSYSASAPQPIAPGPQVSLSGYFNAYGIGNAGSPSINGGFDNAGNSLASAYFGASQTITVNGIPQAFDFAPAGAPDLIDAAGQTVNLPPGKYGNISLIGGAAFGGQLAQPFTVVYTDGTVQTFTQGFSDWYNGATLPGQAVAIPMTYWLNNAGNPTQPGVKLAVYDYQFATDPTRTVQSITLPNDANVKILAINVNTVPAVTGVSPSRGPTTGGTSVTITGSGFTGATGVNFGGTSAASFTINGDGSITAVDPAAGATGAVDVTVVGPGGTSAITAADQFTYTTPPPNLVASPVINGDNPNGLFNAAGQGSKLGVQRSMVEDIVYTFNEPVVINDANAAFTVVGTGPHPGTAPSTLIATAVPGSNETQWAVSLTGKADGVLASIANGEYSITLNPNAVFAAADGTTAMTTGQTDTFYRLFGDINGDKVVNVADEFQFSKAMNTYNPAFDVNGDGAINLADEFQASKSFTSGGYVGDGFVTSI